MTNNIPAKKSSKSSKEGLKAIYYRLMMKSPSPIFVKRQAIKIFHAGRQDLEIFLAAQGKYRALSLIRR